MTAPTLTLGASVVTLPMPAASGGSSTGEAELRVEKRTLSGSLRTVIAWRAWTYAMSFTYCPTATYQAVRDLWAASVAAGSFPVLAAASVFPTAASVAVSVKLGPAAPALPSDPTLVNFTLTLTEVAPR